MFRPQSHPKSENLMKHVFDDFNEIHGMWMVDGYVDLHNDIIS